MSCNSLVQINFAKIHYHLESQKIHPLIHPYNHCHHWFLSHFNLLAIVQDESKVQKHRKDKKLLLQEDVLQVMLCVLYTKTTTVSPGFWVILYVTA